MKKIIFTSAYFLFLSLLFQNLVLGQLKLKSVHEWGTFTTVQNSAGLRLPGLKGEKLPTFVYDMKLSAVRDIELKNVEVQMETPVLYFYADQEMNATVDVRFKNGIINQWYPDRISGQTIASSTIVDMSIPREGSSKWNITILDPSAKPKLIDDWNIITQEYAAPRNTGSNHIKGAGEEYEKFIFYRGLANFETPVKVEFNQQDNLVIHNQFNSSLSYVLVYDNSPNRQPTIWWSGSMKAGEKKVIANPSKDSEFNAVNEEIYNFRDQLVKAGLFREEADAMLSTWFEGYFVNITDVEGLRVFWITPESYIDEMLPLSITPDPASVNRVFIGRSEVLKKDFEKELNDLTIEEIESKYKVHHYLDVFKEAKKKGFPTQWTDYNDNVITSVKDNSKTPLTLKLMPNPIQETFIMQYRSEALADIHVSILDLSGNVIRHWKEVPSEMLYKKSYSMKDLLPGAYILQTRQNEKVNTIRFIKQ
jgi:hypothetical protein